jgi:hypothetical protein
LLPKKAPLPPPFDLAAAAAMDPDELSRLRAEIATLREAHATHEAAVEEALRTAAHELGKACASSAEKAAAALAEARRGRETVLRAVAELRQGTSGSSSVLLPPVLLPPPQPSSFSSSATTTTTTTTTTINSLRSEFEAALDAAVAEMSKHQLAQAEAIDKVNERLAVMAVELAAQQQRVVAVDEAQRRQNETVAKVAAVLPDLARAIGAVEARQGARVEAAREVLGGFGVGLLGEKEKEPPSSSSLAGSIKAAAQGGGVGGSKGAGAVAAVAASSDARRCLLVTAIEQLQGEAPRPGRAGFEAAAVEEACSVVAKEAARMGG